MLGATRCGAGARFNACFPAHSFPSLAPSRRMQHRDVAVPLAVCRVLLGGAEEALELLLEDEQVGASLGCAEV